MSWIHTIPEDEARGELAALYERMLDRASGKLDHVLAVHSLNPRGLAAHFAVYSAAMASTRGLRKVERELIAVVVSQLNGCHY
jgi:alkylhydroperoxidase family enzyme